MKSKLIFFIGILTLILPFIGIYFAYTFFDKFIFDNPDFWYSYMAYFGTVSLAIISVLQSIKTEEISNKFMRQQLQQKIGYFVLPKEKVDKNIEQYKFLYVSCDVDRNDESNKVKLNNLCLWLRNVGEDAILKMNIKQYKINDMIYNVPHSLGFVYKEELILFELNMGNEYDKKIIEIELEIIMKNCAGVSYEQVIDITARKNGENIYSVEKFDSNIKFIEL